MPAVRDTCPKTFYVIISPVRSYFLPPNASAVCKYSLSPNTLNAVYCARFQQALFTLKRSRRTNYFTKVNNKCYY